MKKVVFFIPDLASGGGERVVSELSLHFPRDIETTIVILEHAVDYPYKGKLVSLHIHTAKYLLFRIMQIPVIFFKFRRALSRIRPDYVISLHNVPNMINILASKKAIVRIDTPLSYGYKRGLRKSLLTFFVKMFFGRITMIVAVSQGIKKDLMENFGIRKDKVRVIYNPIDLEKIQTLSKQQLEPQYSAIFENQVLINMGRMIQPKGQWHLIRIFREIKEQHKDAKLVIMGEGETKPVLEALIRKLDLEGQVYLLGWQDNPYKFLARASVFVSPSFGEGMPMSILEALACGLPVVSTDCRTGPREILAPDTDVHSQTAALEYAEYGVLAPVLERAELAATDPLTEKENLLLKGINEILGNTEQADRLKGRAVERARDFDITKIIVEWDFLTK